ALAFDLAERGVDAAPRQYPYRDDALLWLGPIRRFVEAYVGAFYEADSKVSGDRKLQAWFGELIDPACGALREVVPGDRLDSREKLIALLAQVLFIAGPGHASQHFSANHYYRYAPAFAGAAYVPPPWRPELVTAARHRNTLPPIHTANKQVMYNSFTNFQYDVFGDYRRYRLGRLPQARQA